MTTSRPSDEAVEALRIAQSDPARARQLAGAVLSAPVAVADPASASLAERALGLAAREEHDLVGSEHHLRRAVRVAEKAGLAAVAADARVSLAGTLTLKGDWAAAIREADKAAAVLKGLGRARLDVQRSAILMTQGRLDEALEGFRRALPVLRRQHDRLWEARLRANRGLAYHYRGALAAAETDLRKAADLYTELGQPRLAASALQNLGLVVGLMGDIPASLAWFEEADVFFRSRGIVDPRGLNDRSQALLAAGLVSEARACAASAVDALDRQGQKGYLAIARLKLAEAALLDGDPVVARDMAEQARRDFSHQARPGWAALARHVSVRAASAAGDRSPGLLAASRRAADELAQARFALPAADARLLAAQLALHLGRVEIARRELAQASRARRRATVQLRARAWHAEALLRLADGDRRGAKGALSAAVGVLDRYRAALGATELRAHASAHVAEVAAAGLGLAIEDGAPEEVLAWMERWRAGALRMRPSRPRRTAAWPPSSESCVQSSPRWIPPPSRDDRRGA
jgi:tetratricopeptide (TPR) repeat protein